MTCWRYRAADGGEACAIRDNAGLLASGPEVELRMITLKYQRRARFSSAISEIVACFHLFTFGVRGKIDAGKSCRTSRSKCLMLCLALSLTGPAENASPLIYRKEWAMRQILKAMLDTSVAPSAAERKLFSAYRQRELALLLTCGISMLYADRRALPHLASMKFHGLRRRLRSIS